MKLITATLVAITGLGLCAAPVAFGDDNSFVGKWKFNPDKSQLNGLTYRSIKARMASTSSPSVTTPNRSPGARTM